MAGPPHPIEIGFQALEDSGTSEIQLRKRKVSRLLHSAVVP
ncbi:hypothetical protein COLO4_38139 [Corchorus olitorius]|uniref:Uncharacterized protein n=1 Tax=Corchorus olitorius TaxID=93759 RepID=A0A1R3FX36_9ROSI|nr:hypothetical protein COLO4_38139 [Corchorus olitorius]